MNHIVDTCPLAKSESGLNLLYKRMMTQTCGWNLQRLQHSRNNNNAGVDLQLVGGVERLDEAVHVERHDSRVDEVDDGLQRRRAHCAQLNAVLLAFFHAAAEHRAEKVARRRQQTLVYLITHHSGYV